MYLIVVCMRVHVYVVCGEQQEVQEAQEIEEAQEVQARLYYFKHTRAHTRVFCLAHILSSRKRRHNARKHTRTHKHTQAHTYTRTSTHIHTHTLTHTHTTHARTHTYAHAHTHTHIACSHAGGEGLAGACLQNIHVYVSAALAVAQEAMTHARRDQLKCTQHNTHA